ncbi:methyltransferase domain-containing protein [Maridesulfovibrio hydrothermalis]|uniref:Methyltransferase domain-containing protein n=1 Tax=Maridesulfovibrio hydrothermalis AM13 = DSM 14728 TaxID=1121451 RepID=L0RCB3_9BACT|nr:methyltransferase domain-containing protein [Maridesulfovibrio hydrothermalis]CCO23206.1 conserved protein of unknown function [Maridesulfovibrio hydrothermalis AM13 = DSM 14728]
MDEKQILDSVAQKYLNPDILRSTDKQIIELMAGYVLTNMPADKPNVIEMGIGDNVWSSYVLNKFGSSTIIEGSLDLINAVKDDYPNVKFIHSFFEDYIPETKFDQILCSFVLEHVADPVQILKNMKQWIHKDSLVHILVPSANSVHRQHAVKMNLQKNTFDLGPADKTVHHRRVYTLEHITKDITAAGYTITKKEGLFFKAFPNSILAQLSEEQIKGFFDLGFDFPPENGAALYITAKL